MKKRKLINWLCLSGAVSLIFYTLHDVVGSNYYPGYNWIRQAVSDLTSTAAPSYLIANGLSSSYGLFACLCCTLVCIVVQGKGNKTLRVGIYLFAVMNWISSVGYSLFPLSESGYAGRFQDFMHLYIVTVLVVILSIISLFMIIMGTLSGKAGKSLTICAVIALSCMSVGAIGVNAASPLYFGIFERFSTYSAVIFNAILGLYGFIDFHTPYLGDKYYE